MLLSTTVVAAATDEPVTVAEVKTSARMDGDFTELDQQIATLIPSARVLAEQETGRLYASSTLRLGYSDWPRDDLPVAPVTELVSVEYLDGSTWAATAAYGLQQTVEGRGRLVQVADSLPQLGSQAAERVRVTVKAGYEVAPAHIKAWITARCVCMLQNSDPPAYLDGLLDPERDWQ